jgi:hypothetical protein
LNSLAEGVSVNLIDSGLSVHTIQMSEFPVMLERVLV